MWFFFWGGGLESCYEVHVVVNSGQDLIRSPHSLKFVVILLPNVGIIVVHHQLVSAKQLTLKTGYFSIIINYAKFYIL